MRASAYLVGPPENNVEVIRCISIWGELARFGGYGNNVFVGLRVISSQFGDHRPHPSAKNFRSCMTDYLEAGRVHLSNRIWRRGPIR